MSKHITEWLNAYLDGELRGARLQQMELHLAECPDCQAALQLLEKLSDLLHEAPTPEFTPPERFATEVNLLLPHRQITASRRKILEIGWWMIPIGLLGVWVFLGSFFALNDVLDAANRLGLLPGASDWLISLSFHEAYWSATLGQLGVLSGNSLDWAASTEVFTRTSLPQLILQISIALSYLSWLAILWVRLRRRGHRQLLEI
jgi:predicted anti-sigma-YlaC factor YlaD